MEWLYRFISRRRTPWISHRNSMGSSDALVNPMWWRKTHCIPRFLAVPHWLTCDCNRTFLYKGNTTPLIAGWESNVVLLTCVSVRLSTDASWRRCCPTIYWFALKASSSCSSCWALNAVRIRFGFLPLRYGVELSFPATTTSYDKTRYDSSYCALRLNCYGCCRISERAVNCVPPVMGDRSIFFQGWAN